MAKISKNTIVKRSPSIRPAATTTQPSGATAGDAADTSTEESSASTPTSRPAAPTSTPSRPISSSQTTAQTVSEPQPEAESTTTTPSASAEKVTAFLNNHATNKGISLLDERYADLLKNLPEDISIEDVREVIRSKDALNNIIAKAESNSRLLGNISNDALNDLILQTIIKEIRSNKTNTSNSSTGTLRPLNPISTNPEPLPVVIHLAHSLNELVHDMEPEEAEKLGKMNIFDIPTLLVNCMTHEQRDRLSARQEFQEAFGETGTKLTLWAKEANLMRVKDMTPDLAYMLVAIGVRNIGDLALLDKEAALQLIRRLHIINSELVLKDESLLQTVIANANALVGVMGEGYDLDVREEAAPNYILTEKADIDSTELLLFQNGKVIQEGLGFIDEIGLALPLPHVVQGTVYMLENAADKGARQPLAGATVELIGVTSAGLEKDATTENPSCVTDGYGRFAIAMPESYSLQEVVKVRVSQGSNSATFNKTASDIINGVPEQLTLNKFLYIDSLADNIDLLTHELADLNRRLSQTTQASHAAQDAQQKSRLNASAEELRQRIKEKEELKKEMNRNYNEAKKSLPEAYQGMRMRAAFERFLHHTDRLVSTIEGANFNDGVDEGFLVYRDAFTRQERAQSALPSVKLMGNGSESIMLPTDTAPSRVFRYSLLQRLVEPKMSNASGDYTREKMSSPVDVYNFQKQLYLPNGEQPWMSTLGIGYVLNMHQAWVPDGYALGDLLYSTVLAPGEKQELVVQDKSQSYSVADDAVASDEVGERIAFTQTDDTTAALQQAVAAMMDAHSDTSYSTTGSNFGGGLSQGTSASAGGTSGGIIGSIGLSRGGSLLGGLSKSSGKASSNARQNNTYNEASQAAQHFQHSIQMASSKISSAKRLSVRTATAAERNSASSRVIANHNHMHTLTLQYWEVMRHYRLETCLEGIDLVLYVPLKPIEFLPRGQNRQLDNNINTPNAFNTRYGVLAHFADTLMPALPARYRRGMRYIQSFASDPNWKRTETRLGQETLTFSFRCDLYACDTLTVSLVLTNGRGTIGVKSFAGSAEFGYNCIDMVEFRQGIRQARAKAPETLLTCEAVLPEGYGTDDIESIRLDYACHDYTYTLQPDDDTIHDRLSAEEYAYWKRYNLNRKNLKQDNKDNEKDIREMEKYKDSLPEFVRQPRGTIEGRDMAAIGTPAIAGVSVKVGGSEVPVICGSNTLSSRCHIALTNRRRLLGEDELAAIEETFHHVLSNCIRYSQVVWSSLTDDERAMLLDRYTINMDFSSLTPDSAAHPDDSISVPLLNCINVKQPLGFFGNCMIFPFTYSQDLAAKLGKTAADIQDELYRYHSTNFRVPVTTISLPTGGMIGEAVLGETIVAEKIDLTRFWNWQDAPLDDLKLTNQFLNNTDYLDGKSPSDISALNLQSAALPNGAVVTTIPDLVKTLSEHKMETFDDHTGLKETTSMLQKAVETNGKSLDNVVKEASTMTSEALKQSASVASEALKGANEAKVLDQVQQLFNMAEKETDADKKNALLTKATDLLSTYMGSKKTAAAPAAAQPKAAEGQQQATPAAAQPKAAEGQQQATPAAGQQQPQSK